MEHCGCPQPQWADILVCSLAVVCIRALFYEQHACTLGGLQLAVCLPKASEQLHANAPTYVGQWPGLLRFAAPCRVLVRQHMAPCPADRWSHVLCSAACGCAGLVLPGAEQHMGPCPADGHIFCAPHHVAVPPFYCQVLPCPSDGHMGCTPQHAIVLPLYCCVLTAARTHHSVTSNGLALRPCVCLCAQSPSLKATQASPPLLSGCLVVKLQVLLSQCCVLLCLVWCI